MTQIISGLGIAPSWQKLRQKQKKVINWLSPEFETKVFVVALEDEVYKSNAINEDLK